MRNRRNQRMLTAFGKTQNLTQWALEYNIHPPVLCRRLKTMSLEDAVKVQPHRRVGSLVAFGKTQSLGKWAVEYKMSVATLHTRLKTMTLEEALTKPKGQRTVPAKPRAKATKALNRETERTRLIGIAVQRLADKGDPTCTAILAKVDEHLDKLLTK